MSTLVVQPKRWSAVRWLRAIVLILALQLGLIFCLSERQPVKARLPHPLPSIHLASKASADLLLLTDPTLFALPHRNGFAGKAWLKTVRLQAPALDWSEPTNWLPLAVDQLGAVFNLFAQTNNFVSWPILSLPEPALKMSTMLAPAPAPAQSVLWIQGALAQRRFTTPLSLRAWPRTELLTNSIVQLVVDAAGQPVSVPILLTSSSDREADDYALAQARSARFEPLTDGQSPKTPLAGLTWGKLIFDWATVPVSPSNAPPAP